MRRAIFHIVKDIYDTQYIQICWCTIRGNGNGSFLVKHLPSCHHRINPLDSCWQTSRRGSTLLLSLAWPGHTTTLNESLTQILPISCIDPPRRAREDCHSHDSHRNPGSTCTFSWRAYLLFLACCLTCECGIAEPIFSFMIGIPEDEVFQGKRL